MEIDPTNLLTTNSLKTLSVSEETQKKAELLAAGAIFVDSSVMLPKRRERATTGPDANFQTLTFSFNDKRVKLSRALTKADTPFCLKSTKNPNQYRIYKENNIFLGDVALLHVPYHAPDQLFMNLCDRCIYHCAFCTLPAPSRLQTIDTKNFISIISNAVSQVHPNAIALTSGIYPNNNKIIIKCTTIITALKDRFPEIPIGIEPTILRKKEIQELHRAGADEIKINLQAPTKQLFQKLCPDFKYQNTITNLMVAVDVFGRGHVTSNIIYGFGETTYHLYNATQKLTSLGVIPTLRKLHLNQTNKRKIEKNLRAPLPSITVKQMLTNAAILKQSLHDHHLTPLSLKTMCYPCECCDINPFTDM